MLESDANRQWFVLFTKVKREIVAQEQLERQGFEVYLPKFEVSTRRKGLVSSRVESFFPRYLFIRFDKEEDDWGPIRSTRGVCDLVRFEGVPKPIPDAVIEMLKSNETADQLQSLSKKTWNPGDEVEIERGPLAGNSCIFHSLKSADRVQVLLNMVGKQTVVSLLKDNLGSPQWT